MFNLRLIQSKDNPSIAQIIRTVSQEFGVASDAGFAVSDPILDDLYQVYQEPNSRYWVVESTQGKIVGGGGIAPLQGDTSILEIQKMYFLPETRGYGLAKQLLQQCFEFAQQQNFQTIYLETTATLYQAVKLYERLGFEHLDQPLGNTGHSNACEIWMAKKLAY